MTDDLATLVKRAQGGDRPAYDELTQRFRSALYALALRWLRNPDDAEDLTQDACWQGFQKLGQLRDCRCFFGWLRQTMARLAQNRLTRQRWPMSLRAEDSSRLKAPASDPVEAAVREERAALVRSCLAALRPRDREILTSVYLRGRTLGELVQEHGAPIGTVKSRLHTARARLRKELKGKGLGS